MLTNCVFAGNENDFHEIIVPGQSFSETVGKLKPSKKYLFFCYAENKIARGEPSEVSNQKKPPSASFLFSLKVSRQL
jgi:hypothetical protein